MGNWKLLMDSMLRRQNCFKFVSSCFKFAMEVVEVHRVAAGKAQNMLEMAEN